MTMNMIIHRDRPDEAEEKMTPERRKAIGRELESLAKAMREDKNEHRICNCCENCIGGVGCLAQVAGETHSPGQPQDQPEARTVPEKSRAIK